MMLFALIGIIGGLVGTFALWRTTVGRRRMAAWHRTQLNGENMAAWQSLLAPLLPPKVPLPPPAVHRGVAEGEDDTQRGVEVWNAHVEWCACDSEDPGIPVVTTHPLGEHERVATICPDCLSRRDPTREREREAEVDSDLNRIHIAGEAELEQLAQKLLLELEDRLAEVVATQTPVLGGPVAVAVSVAEAAEIARLKDAVHTVYDRLKSYGFCSRCGSTEYDEQRAMQGDGRTTVLLRTCERCAWGWSVTP